MREVLTKRTYRFAFGRVDDDVMRLETVGHRGLRSRHDKRLAGFLRKAGGVLGKGLHVIPGTCHGNTDQKCVGSGVLCDRRKYGAKQAAVGQQRSGNIDRIGCRGKTRQDFLKCFLRGGRKGLQRHLLLTCGVCS